MGYIYILINLKNNKQYVGQTVSLKERLRSHIWESKQNNIKLPIHRAIKKYDIENFKIVSFPCPEEDLNWAETFLIKELNTKKPNGYNLTDGGEGLKNPSVETKQKISKSKMGHIVSPETKKEISKSLKVFYKNNPNHNTKENHPNWGKHLSKKHKNNISKSEKGREPWNKGKKMSEEQKKSHYGHPAWNKGIPQTKEAKEKNKLSHMGKKMNEDTNKTHSIQSKKMWANKEFKQKMKNKFKKLWENPEFRKKNLEARGKEK